MIFLNLLLVVAVMTALVTWRLNRRQAAEKTKKTKQVAKDKLTPSPQAPQALLFRSWLRSTDKIEPSLQTWLFTLSEEEFDSINQQVAIYCKSLGMELDWLLDPSHPLDINQPLQKTMIEMVTAYLISRHKAAQVQDDALVFKTYQALNQNPANHPDLIRQLFAKLADNGLVTISSSDLLNDDPQKRQEYMISTIRQTAKHNPVEFNNTLKALVLS